MRVTSVEIHPEGSRKFLELSFRDPRRVIPFNVKNIVGLDADEIVRRYYGGSGSGTMYNLTLQKRDITFSLELNPGYGLGQTYSSLRDEVYKTIASSRTGNVQVQFMEGDAVAAVISGYVSKVEATHFTENPDIQMTVSCMDPFLKSPSIKMIDVSALNPSSSIVVDDISTAPHGFTMEMNVLAAVPIFSMNGAGWQFTVTPAGGFLLGDRIRVASEPTNKQLYVTRAGTRIHLGDRIAQGSVWPILFPGDNRFSFNFPQRFKWSFIRHYATFWGV